MLMRATVIGAGVAGLACAVELAERGVHVEVVERSAVQQSAILRKVDSVTAVDGVGINLARCR